MVRPDARRAVVRWAEDAYRVSERRACRALGVNRSVVRYRSVRPHQTVLRERVRELAAVRVHSGYRQIHVFLRREGWPVNAKRVYRLYTEEGLTLKRRRPKRHRSAAVRQQPGAPVAPHEAWAMDFIHDTLADGRTIRVLTAIDVFTRECVALEAAPSFRGSDVARALGAAGSTRQLPARIRVDNGTEFTSKALDHWAYWNQVQLDFIRPGKPTDNPFIEAFNATLRRECLSQHWFIDLEDARTTLAHWKEDYNNHRPHSSLENQPPAHFGAGGAFIPDRNRLQKLRC
jgi:putative transposase